MSNKDKINQSEGISQPVLHLSAHWWWTNLNQFRASGSYASWACAYLSLTDSASCSKLKHSTMMRSKGFRNSACRRIRQTRYVKLRKHIYQGNFNQSSSLVNFTSELKRLQYKSCLHLHAIACINTAHICTRDYRIW